MAIGGEIKAKENNPIGKAWNVGIFILLDYEGCEYINPPKVSLKETTIATSGRSSKRSHITDPETGKEVSNFLVSVSVINSSYTTADALVTALFVMGHERGVTWARNHQVKVIFILE